MMHTTPRQRKAMRHASEIRIAAMRGAAAVELAIMLIVMVPLAFGVAEFGRALYQYNTLVKTVRDAARLLSQHNPSDDTYPIAQATCLALHGNVDCSGPLLAPGLTSDMVTICDRVNACAGDLYGDVGTGSGLVNLVEVRISGYQLAYMLPAFVQSYFGVGPAVTFGPIRAVMRQVI
jgi:Flp pilus assembly protein TadG